MKMKSIVLSLLFTFAISLFSLQANAQRRKSSTAKTVHVKSYTKKNGTRVSSHYRSRKGYTGQYLHFRNHEVPAFRRRVTLIGM
jgi:uncharacterized protein (DUF2141 family)